MLFTFSSKCFFIQVSMYYLVASEEIFCEVYCLSRFDNFNELNVNLLFALQGCLFTRPMLGALAR